MSQESETDSEETGYTRSGKRFKVDLSSSFFDDTSTSTREQTECHRKRKLEGIPSYLYTPYNPSGAQHNPTGTPSSSSNTVHTTSNPPATTPPSGSTGPNQNRPLRNRMVDDTKLPTFKGTGGEDPEQHWFLCEAIWTIKQIQDDNVKLVQLATTLRDRALTWYMKYTTMQNRTLAQVRNAMIKEFKKPKSESQ